MTPELLADEERTGEVDRKHALPFIARRFERRLVERHASIVDQHVHAAACVNDTCEACSTLACSVTSSATAIARAPAASIAATVSASIAVLRSATATSQPSLARATALAWPIP